mmetsp:Transcript_36583/g.109926  ORF Transcript_36583/g.109926 Transcript_36583/m.109926 type:complete len:227 (-) Transcript_36583:631-1311(-)
MGLIPKKTSKLHMKILKEKWPSVLSRVTDAPTKARTPNSFGDLPLHYACYAGSAPPSIIRALLVAYTDGAGVRNNGGFLPLAVAEVNYQGNSPHRAEVLEMLRVATKLATFRAEADLSTSACVTNIVYRTSATCVVCLDEDATEVVVPCGHLCLCKGCAELVKERRVCPMGRCFVGDIVTCTAIDHLLIAGDNSSEVGGPEELSISDEIGCAGEEGVAVAETIPAC